MSSTRRTKIIDYSYDDIKSGCNQLSRRRAGCVWTHFVDLTDRELQMLLVGEAPTALDALSTRMFKNMERRHVSALSFSAEGEVREIAQCLPGMVNRTFSKQGVLPTHYNPNAAFPLVPGSGVP